METKKNLNLDLLAETGGTPLLAVYMEFNHLKQLYRQGWLQHGIDREQCESVAEHVLGVAMLAWWIGEQHFPKLDTARLIRLALVHDLGEIYAGDLTPRDGVTAEEKHARERAAVGQVLGRLENGAAQMALWEEYESGSSAEARLVRELDRLEMAFQALVYAREGAGDLEDFFVSAEGVIHEPALVGLLEAARKVNRN